MGVIFPDWMHGLSPRARRCLLVGGYTTRIDVVVATDIDLLTVRGLGVKTLRELNAWRRPSTKDAQKTSAQTLAPGSKLSRRFLTCSPKVCGSKSVFFGLNALIVRGTNCNRATRSSRCVRRGRRCGVGRREDVAIAGVEAGEQGRNIGEHDR